MRLFFGCIDRYSSRLYACTCAMKSNRIPTELVVVAFCFNILSDEQFGKLMPVYSLCLTGLIFPFEIKVDALLWFSNGIPCSPYFHLLSSWMVVKTKNKIDMSISLDKCNVE